jgi:hypothetical protein
MEDYEYERRLAIGERAGREKTCGVKVDYRTESKAESAAIMHSSKAGYKLEAYPCFFCGGWHIGRKQI